MVRCSLDPALGPPAPAEDLAMPRREKLALLKGLILPIMIVVWVLGSIYGGIASVTEFGGRRRLSAPSPRPGGGAS